MIWKRVASLAAVVGLSLALTTGVFVSPPQAAGAQVNASEECKESAELAFEVLLTFFFQAFEADVDISHDDCVNLLTGKNIDATVNGICKDLDEEGVLEDEGVNRGECKEILADQLPRAASEIRERAR